MTYYTMKRNGGSKAIKSNVEGGVAECPNKLSVGHSHNNIVHWFDVALNVSSKLNKLDLNNNQPGTNHKQVAPTNICDILNISDNIATFVF